MLILKKSAIRRIIVTEAIRATIAAALISMRMRAVVVFRSSKKEKEMKCKIKGIMGLIIRITTITIIITIIKIINRTII